MKNKNMKKGIVIFTALGILAGGIIGVQAATEDTSFKPFQKMRDNISEIRQRHEGVNINNLSEEERVKFEEEREARRAKAETRREEMQEKREKIDKAIEEGDYQTWKSLVPNDCPMLEDVTEENFSSLKDMNLYRAEMGKNRVDNFPGRGRHRMINN